MRVSFDTNVFGSASPPGDSAPTCFRSFSRIINRWSARPSWAGCDGPSAESSGWRRRWWLRVETFVRSQAEVVAEAPPVQLAVRDAADRLVVAGAVAGRAEVLVTGDRDWLSIAAEAPLPIVAPRAFWELLKAGPRGAPGAS